MSLVFPFIFLFNFIRSYESFADWKNHMANSNEFFTLYICIFMLTPVILMVKYSDQFKASWIYKAVPIDDMASIFKGVYKGVFYKMILPVYLAEHNINLVYVNSEEEKLNKETEPKEIIREVVREKEYKYETVFGAKLDEKPEHMTHLTGNLLVFKDHKRIIFRGKIDSLEARIVETQVLCHKQGMNKLVEDLQEILNLIGRILRCEVLSEPLEGFSLQGMTEKDLRENHITLKNTLV